MRIPTSHRDRDRDRDNGEMTPMIDVVFLLLIFFVVASAGYMQEAVLSAELPALGAVDSAAAPEVVPQSLVEVWVKISVDPQTGRATADMNGTVYDRLDDLRTQLRALAAVGPENPVILDIAPEVALSDLIDVYDTCRGAGFQSVSFAVGAATTSQP